MDRRCVAAAQKRTLDLFADEVRELLDEVLEIIPVEDEEETEVSMEEFANQESKEWQVAWEYLWADE